MRSLTVQALRLYCSCSRHGPSKSQHLSLRLRPPSPTMQTITTSAARLPVQDQLLSSAAATVYVITGTTRGIGYGLVEWLASRPNAIIYAGARHASTATKLHQLIARHGSHVRLLQLDAESERTTRWRHGKSRRRWAEWMYCWPMQAQQTRLW